MTTIIGYNTQNQVIFGADRQESSLKFNGDFESVKSTTLKKIYPIADKIVIAAGGITEPTKIAIDEIKKTIGNEEYDVSTLLEICKNQFPIAHKAF